MEHPDNEDRPRSAATDDDPGRGEPTEEELLEEGKDPGWPVPGLPGPPGPQDSPASDADAPVPPG